MQPVERLTMNPRLRSVLSAALLAAVWLSHATPVSARPTARKLQPVDEAKKDASLLRFRAQLQAAIARHDVAALRQSTDPDIRYSFGADGGRQSFLARFSPAGAGAASAPSPLWAELGRVLSLGGALVSPTEFCAPYVFARFPEDLDAFAYVVVTSVAAPVRAQPAEDAPVLETLHYDIVRRDEKGGAPATVGTRAEWVRVVTPTGKSGYLHDRDLRSPTDYRACFHKDAGQWLLTTFVAGD
jgi:hypothetical protein